MEDRYIRLLSCLADNSTATDGTTADMLVDRSAPQRFNVWLTARYAAKGRFLCPVPVAC
jgi:hypothetical protein